MLTKKPKNGILIKEVHLPDKFRPNAFLIQRRKIPPLIVSANPIEAVAVISSVGLNWNTTSDKRSSDNYPQLLDRIMEKLPLRRKFRGGVFYVQIHAEKRVSWETGNSKGIAAAIYALYRKRGGVCVENLKITVGGYAGDDLKSAIFNAIRTGKKEIFEVKRGK